MFHNHYNIETLLSLLCSTPNFFDTLPLRSRHRISQQVVRNTRSYNSMTAWSQTFEIAVPNHSLDITYWKFPFEAPGEKNCHYQRVPCCIILSATDCPEPLQRFTERGQVGNRTVATSILMNHDERPEDPVLGMAEVARPLALKEPHP